MKRKEKKKNRLCFSIHPFDKALLLPRGRLPMCLRNYKKRTKSQSHEERERERERENGLKLQHSNDIFIY